MYIIEVDPTEIVVCVVMYCWLQWNEINKPLHSNGHVPNITHVGGVHKTFELYKMFGNS
jgi:hypothetical protein